MKLALKDKIWLAGLMICIFINISWFVSDAVLGGSARYGEVVKEIYYVANHGTMTEVSEASWRWNLRLNTMARVSVPLTFVMFWLASNGMATRRFGVPLKEIASQPLHQGQTEIYPSEDQPFANNKKANKSRSFTARPVRTT